MTSSAPARTTARGRGALALLAVAAAIVAGCSSSPSESAATSTGASERDAAVRFAECMRDNGVRDFPDPDASGELTIDGVLNGSSLDPDSPTWTSAVAACKQLEPPGFTGGRRTADQQAAGLAFAQCIRDNGVKDFPDPVNGEPLVDTNKIPSAATDDGMAILNAAMQTCGDFAEGIVTDR